MQAFDKLRPNGLRNAAPHAAKPDPFWLSLSKPCAGLRQAQRERVCFFWRAAWHALNPGYDYFKLIVVLTPCDVVLSSNHRAVTVLVCV